MLLKGWFLGSASIFDVLLIVRIKAIGMTALFFHDMNFQKMVLQTKNAMLLISSSGGRKPFLDYRKTNGII